MYKPHTIEQYRIQQLLGDFAMERFLIDLISQMSLFLKNKTGEQIAFGFGITKTIETNFLFHNVVHEHGGLNV